MAAFFYLFALTVFILVKWSVLTYDYFKKQGIPFRRPVPFFGTNSNFITKKKPFATVLNEWYREFPNEK